ncbi:hypothetical protein [Lacticaseibacillus camelliae]|nr:hypothetical protein [Lacticaseibacillus camelliae]
MADANDQSFPSGEFTAFSTAKMTYFMLVRADLTRADIEAFFGDDARYVALTKVPSVELHLPQAEAQIAVPGNLIAKFANGKYKVITQAYYHQNFNEPIADANGQGIH